MLCNQHVNDAMNKYNSIITIIIGKVNYIKMFDLFRFMFENDIKIESRGRFGLFGLSVIGIVYAR